MLFPTKLKIFTDGGARGNPGPAAAAVVICDTSGKIFKEIGKYLGEKTNNEAEYEAVILALSEAAKLGAEQMEINLDSELVGRQLNSVYKIKNIRMQELAIKVRHLETGFKKVVYKTIPREKNAAADALVNAVIDEGGESNV